MGRKTKASDADVYTSTAHGHAGTAQVQATRFMRSLMSVLVLRSGLKLVCWMLNVSLTLIYISKPILPLRQLPFSLFG